MKLKNHVCLEGLFALLLVFFSYQLPLGAATVTWVGGSGDWNTTNNWSTGALPGTNDDVVIASGPGITVTHSAGTHTVRSVQNQQAFVLSGGSLSVSTTFQESNTFTLSGGTLANATLVMTNGIPLAVNNGTLDGVTVNGVLDVGNSVNGARLTVLDGLTLNGTALVGNPTNQNYGYLDFSGTQTLGGSGTVVFGNSPYYNGLLLANSATTLTIGAGMTIEGQGWLGYSPYIGGAQNGTIINQGIISANVNGGTITIYAQPLVNSGTVAMSSGGSLNLNYLANVVGLSVGGSGALTLNGNWVNNQVLAVNGTTLNFNGNWTNAGTVNMTNATLNLGGTFVLTNLGNLNRSGGTVNLTGTLVNSNATLILNAVTGPWVLSGGDIQGGTIAPASGTLFTVNSGTLDGVTVNGVLDVGNSVNGARLTVLDGLTLNGTALVGNPTNSNYGYLEFSGTQTLGGSGTVVFGNSPYYDALLLANSATTLTIGAGMTIEGQGWLGYSPYLGGAQNGTITNQGIISANVNGGTITIYAQPLVNSGTVAMSNGGSLNINYLPSVMGLSLSGSGTLTLNGNWVNDQVLTVNGTTLNFNGNWTNAGTMNFTNSTVNLGGTFVLSNLGVFNRSGGMVNLTGTLVNSNTTLTLNAASGPWVLDGGTLEGGAITETSTNDLIVSSGTLDGVTVNGVLDVGNSINGARLTVLDGLTLNGTALVGNPTNQNYGYLDFSGTQTLGGSGTVVFGNSPYYNGLLLANSATALTIGPGITIEGQNGWLGYSPYIGGTQNGIIINQGVISADVSGGTITIYAQPFTNQGLAQGINGGSLSISGLQNSVGGTMTFNGGGGLTLSGSWGNAGTITGTNATFNLGGTFVLSNLGVFNRNGGTVNLTGTLNNTNTTLTLNAVTGPWVLDGGDIQGGTIAPASGALFTVSSGTLDGVTVDGNWDVGSSIIGASLTVLDGLTVNGTLQVGNPTNQNYGRLDFSGTQILGGSGTVVFGNSPYYDALLLANSATALTIGPGIAIEGQNGWLGYSPYIGGVQNGTIINQGVISADVSGGTITIYAQLLSNAGTLSAPIGTLSLNGACNLTGGTIELGISGLSSFGQINFAGNVSFAGTLGISLNNGYQPSLGNSFAVLNYGSENGSFGAYNLPSSNLPLQLNYGAGSLTVTAAPQLVPTVNIISPTNNSTFTTPVNITISATATSLSGTITKVDFFEGNNQLGEDLNSPYSVTWSNVPPGVYPLDVTATDTTGAVGASSTKIITVLPTVQGTNFTWVGSVSSDWFTAGNWSPAGVPGASDEANILNGGTATLSGNATIGFMSLSSGTINGAGLLSVGNTFYWTGGSISCPLMIQTNSQMIMQGSAAKSLFGVLTNAGTVDWAGTGYLQIYNYAPSGYTGGIVNEAGAVFNVQSDQTIYSAYGPEYFNNAGTFEKFGTTGTTTINVSFNSAGAVDVESGSVDFNANGSGSGTFNVAANAGIGFNANYGGTAFTGVGNYTVTGGTLTLNGTVQNLFVTGGTVDGVNAGISNLTWNAGTIGGNDVIIGSANWTGGSIGTGGSMTVLSNVVMNINGSAAKSLFGVLTNAGTVDWAGTGYLQIYNYSPSGYTGGIVNEAGAVFNVLSDQGIYNAYGNEYFNNAGLFRKSPTAGATVVNVTFANTGTVDVESGTVDFTGNGSGNGTFNAAANTGIIFAANNTGTAFTGAGNYTVTGGTLTLNGTVQNLFVTGGTVDGVNAGISNLTWSAGTMGGNDVITGLASWTGGSIGTGSSVTILSNAVMNINGSTSKSLFGVLTNAGTVDWAGTGYLQIYNYSPSGYTGGIENEVGAVFNAENDQTIYNAYGTEYFDNEGTFEKSGTAGTTIINVGFTNSGTLGAQSGTISLAGAHSLTNGTLSFGISGTTNFGQLNLAGTAGLTGTLENNILNGYLPNLGDTFSLITYGSHVGAFENLNLSQLAAGEAWQVSYTTGALMLQVVTDSNVAAQIMGFVQDNQGHPITNVNVFAYTTNSSSLYVSGVTDSNGDYALNVANGNWVVGVQGLVALGYNSVPTQVVTVSNGNQVANFIAQPFSGQNYSVTLAVSPAGTGTVSGAGIYPSGSIITVVATPATNPVPYLFTDWTENGAFASANGSYTFSVTRDRQLVANFAIPVYTISAVNNPPGAGSVSGTGSYNYGTTNVLTATPVFGYGFSNWTEGANIVGTSPVLTTVVYTNHAFSANYAATNLSHVVTTATSPIGVATVSGAGVYGNGQSATFSAPASVISSPYLYVFQDYTLSNSVVSGSASFSKTFSTLDATNLLYVAVYRQMSSVPLVVNVAANFNSPVPATTNFLMSFQFDRAMNTNFTPVVVLTNGASGATQPVVPDGGGYWSSSAFVYDTYHAPPIIFASAMDGTNQVYISGAEDTYGDVQILTNLTPVVVDATPPVLSNITVAPAVISAFVTWNSDKPASSLVEYGITPGYGTSTPLDGSLVTAHGVTVNGLSPMTAYHFRVHSRDLAGNETISGDNNFATYAAPDLEVTNLSIAGSLVSGNNIVISWADTNAGAGATFTSWYDQVVVSNITTGQTLLSSAVYYDSSAGGNIASGGFQNRQIPFTLPNGLAGAGSLKIMVTVNAYNNQYEANGSGTAQNNNTASLNAISALGLYADLQVTGLSVTNSQIQSGNTVGVIWNDLNSGQGAVTNSFQDRVLVVNQTTGQTLVNTLLPYDMSASGPIGGGQSMSRQFSFGLPDGVPGAGTLQIAVTVNSLNNVFEYNTNGTAQNNNTSSITAVSSLSPYPDLTVTNILAPASANAGQTVQITWTDVNLGNAPATHNWFDQVFLTGVDQIGGGQLLGTFAVTNSLGLNESNTMTQMVALPQFIQGTQWVVVKVNAAGGVFETDTTNNSGISGQPIVVMPTLGLSLSPSNIAESAGTNAVTATLTRNGDISGALVVQLATETGTNEYAPASITIPAGQSAVSFAIGPVDQFFAGSPVTETIFATANGFPMAVATQTILENDPTTLALSLSANSVSANAGANAIAGTVTRNANFGNDLAVALSSDLPGVVGVPANVMIPAGQRSASFGLTPVPVTGIGDTHLAHILATAAGYGSVSAPIQVMDPNVLPLTLTIENSTVSKGAGNSADSGAVSIPAPLAGAQSIQLTVQNDSVVTVPSVVVIPAGATYVNFNIAVANDNLVTGTQTATILAQALTPQQIAETNGEASATLQVLDVNGPTLTLAPASSTITKSNSTTVTVTRNTPPTNALTVTLSSFPSGIISTPASIVLAVNQTSNTFTASGVQDNMQTGSQQTTLSASATGYNSTAAQLTVSDIYLPDLVPTVINVPSNGLTGSPTTISWVVANNGLGAVTNQTWRDFVYLATDNLGQNETLMAIATNATSLPVGASYSNQASIYLPSVPGNYWIVVVADGGNVVAELNKQNNTIVSPQPVSVNPSYRAAVTNVTPALADQGTPVVISGWAYNPVNNQPAPNSTVAVSVQVNGTTRLFFAASDANGNFTYTFQPLATESGDYGVGADFPSLSQISPQASFVLLGMQALPAKLSPQLLPNTPLTGQFVLTNATDHDLTGLAVTVPDLHGDLVAQFTLTNTTLPGGGAVTVNYSLTSALTHNAQINFSAIVSSAEGAQVTIPVNASVVPLVPQLIANPGYLSSGMIIGEQTVLTFDIQNTGGASSGDLTVLLPTNLSWMTLGSAATIPSIPAGGKATVTLILNPPTDLTLTLYTGNLAAFNQNTGLNLAFQIRAVSESTGDLRVTTTDDYTYYVAGAPKVTNAIVTIRDPFTGIVVAQTNSDTNGIADFPALPAGPYTVWATATEHNQFQGSISVVAGITNSMEAFMPRELVSYQWTVVPTEISDQYQIVLQSVFQTAVPVPNVVISEPKVLLPVAPGVASQFVITMSNEGLIQAENVSITVPDDPTYLVTPLVTNVGIIPAMSSIQVPVTVQLRSAPAPSLVRGQKGRVVTSHDEGGCSLSDLNGCLPDIPLGVVYYYVCGNNNVLEQRSIDLSVLCTANDVKECLDSIKETAGSENIYSLGCNAISEFLSCAGVEMSPCQKAAVSTTCGALSGLEGGLPGAVAGGLAGGGSDILQCLCDLLKSISLPSFPASGGGGGGGGGGGWFVGGGGITVGSTVSGGDCSSGSTQQPRPHTAAILTSMPRLRPPQKQNPSAGVCATVRLQIDQSVIMSRSAFAGTLEIDNGGATSITGIQVNLNFRDATNGDASDKFGIEGPVLSALTAVDGTGTLAGGGTGSAVYTFVPTDDAAPTAPATYQIGGTLTYVDGGQTVTVPLLSAPITVYPEAKLDLVYFQQRDVYGPDALDPALSEPSQPFDLGLIVKNIGAGTAHNFQITSGQPQIVDNEKGLLINFTIIGTEVGDQALTPSLSANLGDISPGGSKEVTWEMLSTLAGKFISFSATFQHVDDLGKTNTSLIDSVEIHSLTHKVLANRPTDDDIPDFLVNDIPNPDSLPDTLYLSDGTVAAVNVVTTGTFDAPVGPGHLAVRLTTSVSNGWNYIQLPDPGVGYLLDSVVRSDGEVLPMTNDAWTTALSFPSSSPAPVAENLVHLFDWAGTGAYTLYYHSTNVTPPVITQLGPVTPFTQPGAVSSVNITFSEPIDVTTFSYSNLTLTLNGGGNLITSGGGISLAQVSGSTYSINGLAPFTATDGNYQLTVSGEGIFDLWQNNAGNISASTMWAKGNAAPVIQSISQIVPNPRNVPVSSASVMFSKSINPATFGNGALTLSLNGGPNLINGSVTLTAQASNVFAITGLGSLTGAQGNYVLTASATGVQDLNGTSGFGSQSASWTMITTGPTITALQPITTNPRNIVVQNLTVTFSEPIDPSTFGYGNLTLTLNGGANLITSAVGAAQVSPTTYEITNINWVQGYAGTYSLTVNAAGIMDLAGNPGSGSTNESWTMVLEVPPTPTNLSISPDLGISPTDGLTSTNNIIFSGSVGASNLTVQILDATTSEYFGTATVVGTNFSIPLSFAIEGGHQLQANAVDAAGNVSLAAFFNLFLDVIPPTAIIQQVTTPTYAAVQSIPVTFSKGIISNTISATNFVVTRNGTSTMTPTLTYVSSNEFVIGNLGAFTAPLGNYQVSLFMNGIQDYAGNVNTNIITMSWVRATTNLPPVMAQITNRVVPPDGAVLFQVQATDPNGDLLAYSIDPGAPPTARINPTNGLFLWAPTRAYASTTNSITIRVTDDGNPPMSATQSFQAIVLDYLQLTLGSTNLQAGQSASLPIYLSSSEGLTNLVFNIAWPGDRFTNTTILSTASGIGSNSIQDQVTNLLIAVQAAPGQILQNSQQILQLNFSAVTNQGSAFVPLTFGNVSAIKPGNLVYSNYVTPPGTVAVIQDEPLLQANVGTNQDRILTLIGRLDTDYQVQFSTDPASGLWLPALNYTQTNGVISIDVSSTNTVIFYRLMQQ